MIFGFVPIEIAKESYNWYRLSREFYVAAKSLAELKIERTKNYKDFINKVVDDDCLLNVEKSRLRTPIIYNYSFAIELIVKGILIKSEPDSYITKEGSINFSHKTIIKGINSLNIIWEDNENVIINNLIDYVTFGKYPAKTKVPTMQEMIDNLKPFDLHWNWTYVDIIKSFKALDSIYLKLNEKYIEKL